MVFAVQHFQYLKFSLAACKDEMVIASHFFDCADFTSRFICGSDNHRVSTLMDKKQILPPQEARFCDLLCTRH